MAWKKINFAMRGSLRDAQGQRTPNYECTSPRFLETEINDSVQLALVSAYEPAIFPDGAFLLEPASGNLITWNMDMSNPAWQRGSNVFIQSDRGIAPDNSYLADQVAWVSGFGNTQKIVRSFFLDPDRTYQLTFLLQGTGGRCGINDVIRVTGNVQGAPKVGLDNLNNYLGKYRRLSIPFRTAGSRPVLPSTTSQAGFVLTAVSANTVTLAGLGTVNANALVGGQISFTIGTGTYEITANTVAVGGSAVVTVDSNELLANGVTTTARAILKDAAAKNVTVEIYCESTFSLLWGGAKLWAAEFEDSMIYQAGERISRSGATLQFQTRDNPLVDLANFGVFGDLKYWRGDGNLADFGDLKIQIKNKRLRVVAGLTEVLDPDELPVNGKFFLSASAESSSISLFVNGKLKQRSVLSNFRPSPLPLTLTSEGVRAWNALVTYGQTLLDGKPNIGGDAQQEVAALFDSAQPIVPPDLISSGNPTFTLPLVTVPGYHSPELEAKISAINTSTSGLQLDPVTPGFLVGDAVQVVRRMGDGQRQRIGWFRVIVVNFPGFPSGTYVSLDGVTGIQVGDILVRGRVDTPGRAFIRFPFVPIDERRILEVDEPGKRVRVDTALSFLQNVTAVVRKPTYQDVTEVLIRLVDPATGWMTLSDVRRIEVGHLISQVQPGNETLISPSNYVASMTTPTANIRIAQKAQNGLLIENSSADQILVTPKVEVYL